MSIFAVVNHKGGVGKTTTAISLASVFALEKKRTLIIDLDPHASLSNYLAFDPEKTQGGCEQIFEQAMRRQTPDLDSLVRATTLENLYLIPASTALATIERRGASAAGLGLSLRDALNGSQEHFDHVLIDTAPTLGVLMISALAACERVIIPVQTDFLSIRGLDLITRTLDRIRQSRGWDRPSLIVPTFYDKRTKASQNGLLDLERRYSRSLWRDVIPVDSGIRNASAQGIPYPLYNRRGRAAMAYAALASDLAREEAEKPLHTVPEQERAYA